MNEQDITTICKTEDELFFCVVKLQVSMFFFFDYLTRFTLIDHSRNGSFAYVSILRSIRPEIVLKVLFRFDNENFRNWSFICFILCMNPANKHFVSFCFINKRKNILCKRFYYSFDQNSETFERFHFVSIMKNFGTEALFALFYAWTKKINTSFH